MDFTPEILSLENAVSYLKEVLRMPLEKLDKKQTRRVFDKLTRVIDDVYYIDDLMPLEEFADKFTDGEVIRTEDSYRSENVNVTVRRLQLVVVCETGL